jgi:Cft2 family RNA processing exonuclease
VEVNCKVRALSFSAHADAKGGGGFVRSLTRPLGILGLIRQVRPRNVMLVHGEKAKMCAWKLAFNPSGR